MYSLDVLLGILNKYKQEIIFKDNEQEEAEYRYLITEESRLSIKKLEFILEKFQDNTECDIALLLKKFLNYRWQRVINTDASYLQFPDSPINKICFVIAQYLEFKEPQLRAWKLLMPTLEISSYLDGSEIFEKMSADSFYDFIMTDDGTELLPIDFCLRSLMHCKYLETVHVPIGIKANRLLSKNEIFLLKHSLGKSSLDLFNELSLRKSKVMSNDFVPNNLREALVFMCDILTSSGEKGAGTDMLATELADVVITKFFHLWRELSLTEQVKVSEIVMPDRRLLQDYFLMLFYYSGNIVDEVIEQEIREIKLIRCVDLAAKAIKEVVHRNDKLFSGIILHDSIAQNFTDINHLFEQCEKNIPHRSCEFAYGDLGQEKLQYTNLQIVLDVCSLKKLSEDEQKLCDFALCNPVSYFNFLEELKDEVGNYQLFLMNKNKRRNDFIFYCWAKENLELYYNWLFNNKGVYHVAKPAIQLTLSLDQTTPVYYLAKDNPINYFSLLRSYADNIDLFLLLITAKHFEQDDDLRKIRPADVKFFSKNNYALILAFNDPGFYTVFMKDNKIGEFCNKIKLNLKELFLGFPAKLVLSVWVADFAPIQQSWIKDAACEKKLTSEINSYSSKFLSQHVSHTNYKENRSFFSLLCFNRFKKNTSPVNLRRHSYYQDYLRWSKKNKTKVNLNAIYNLILSKQNHLIK